MHAFPETLLKIASNCNDEINNDNDDLNYILVSPTSRLKIDTITVKQLQNTLETALGKVDVRNFNGKLGTDNFDPNDILKFRKFCKNVKLKNIYFRLIHKDFFTYSRMKKYKTTLKDECPRCSRIETINNLLWECVHAQKSIEGLQQLYD